MRSSTAAAVVARNQQRQSQSYTHRHTYANGEYSFNGPHHRLDQSDSSCSGGGASNIYYTRSARGLLFVDRFWPFGMQRIATAAHTMYCVFAFVMFCEWPTIDGVLGCESECESECVCVCCEQKCTQNTFTPDDNTKKVSGTP